MPMQVETVQGCKEPSGSESRLEGGASVAKVGMELCYRVEFVLLLEGSLATKAVMKDEDEWKEFEQKEVDYRGLQVQTIQISEKEEDDNKKREDSGDNWEEGGGGGGSGVEKSSGPWNKTALVQAPSAPVTVTETPELVMTSSVYRPPGARLTTTRKTPEMYSNTQFPSLQSTAKHVGTWKYRALVRVDYLRFAALIVDFMWIPSSG
ncbi:LOW QUALITY PROTEIN: protein CDV3 homolog [Choloepus didactylus]|uniref:LOW QUALITY PROTEIN: protein CDV3 homolog n=1 Tax=Choloepus didactylus TaxID=27675 RepID=UPI0018A0D0FF|nr:LOW QUALITY PROTEIN: protein CDV3 homolog [Choloepus didactylus]